MACRKTRCNGRFEGRGALSVARQFVFAIAGGVWLLIGLVMPWGSETATLRDVLKRLIARFLVASGLLVIGE